MGVFIIKPFRLANVTCDLGGGSTSYQIIASSVDMGESARPDAIKKGTPVRISFDAIIFGSTQANAFANFDTFAEAIHDHDGYIQFRPIGLNSAMSTYYHYMRGDKPKIEKTGLLSDPKMARFLQENTDRSTSYGIACSIVLQTKPRPTSDPETLVTAKSQTTIEGTDYGGDDCSIVVESSALKGDALLPVIEIVGAGGGGNDLTKLLVHKRKMRDGAQTNLDFIEGEDMAGTGWSNFADATASGGSCKRTNDASTNKLSIAMPAFDSTYLGIVAPVVVAKITAGTTYKVRFTIDVNGREVESTGWQEVTNDEWDIYHKLGELNLPPFPVPERVKDDTTPTIAQFVAANVTFNIQAERLTGSDYIFIDFIVLPVIDDFFALFLNSDSAILGAGTNTLQVDSVSEHSYLLDSSDYMLDSWSKRGPRLSDLILESEYDHRIRFFAWNGDEFDSSWQISVTIKGIWTTTIPFGES